MGSDHLRGVQQKCRFYFKHTHYAAFLCLWSGYLRNTYRWLLFFDKITVNSLLLSQKMTFFEIPQSPTSSLFFVLRGPTDTSITLSTALLCSSYTYLHLWSEYLKNLCGFLPHIRLLCLRLTLFPSVLQGFSHSFTLIISCLFGYKLFHYIVVLYLWMELLRNVCRNFHFWWNSRQTAYHFSEHWPLLQVFLKD